MTIQTLDFLSARAVPEPKNMEANGDGTYIVYTGDDYTPPDLGILTPITVNLNQLKQALSNDGKLVNFQSEESLIYDSATNEQKVIYDSAKLISSDDPLAIEALSSIGYDDTRTFFDVASTM